MVKAPAGDPVEMHRWQRYLRDHPTFVDTMTAAALVTLSFPGIVLGVDGPPLPRSARWPAWLLMGIACAALMWHRKRPGLTAAVTIACTASVTVLGLVLTPLLLAPLMVALFLVATRASQRTASAYTTAAIIIVSGTALISGPAMVEFSLRVIGPGLWLLLPAVLGSEVRLRLAYLDAVRARAEHAERTREDEARHRVAEERMRIARELHDAIAHHLALANAQATTVAHLMGPEGGQARTMAGELSGTISSALRELKATVGLLRQPDDPTAPLEPAPGLAQLPDLAASFSAAGLTVTVTTEGEPQLLSPGLDLTAYRIIQEALTNVTKHATTAYAQHGEYQSLDLHGETECEVSHSSGVISWLSRDLSVVKDAGGGPGPGRGRGCRRSVSVAAQGLLKVSWMPGPVAAELA